MIAARTSLFATLFVMLTTLAIGCTDSSATPDVAEVPDMGEAQEAEKTPAAEATPPASPPPATDELNAAHIIIMHKDSERVPPGISRTKEEALLLAQQVAEMAKADDADFSALAQEHSDGPSAPNGGNLGNFSPRQMVPAFSQAVLAMAVGDVSDPVETPFGYHVIRRQDLQIIPKISAKHILVMYAGSAQAPPEITRTKEEAAARIQECLEKHSNGEAFEDLAKKYSDGPSAPQGGDLGEFAKGMMVPVFEEAAFNCDVGSVTEVVETPFGFHIIYRYK